MKVLVFGNSHVAALIKAYREGVHTWDIDFVCVPNPKQHHVSINDHGLCFDKAIYPAIERSFGRVVSTVNFNHYDRIVFVIGRSRQHFQIYQSLSLINGLMCGNMREDYVSLMKRFSSKVIFIGSPPLIKNDRQNPPPELIETWNITILPKLRKLSEKTLKSSSCFSVLLPPKEIMDSNNIFVRNEFKRFPTKWDDNHLSIEAGGIILNHVWQSVALL